MGHYPHFTTRRWPGGSQKTLRLHMGIALACERAGSQKEPAYAAHVSFLNRRLFMDEPQHRTPVEARAGTTPHIVRYILGISLALVAIAFLVIFLGGG